MKRTGRLRHRKRAKPPSKETYPDCQGLGFDEARLFVEQWYGKRPGDWPKVVRVRDSKVCTAMHILFGLCWECDAFAIEAHHMASGFLRGKTDEMAALAMLCKLCHANVNTPALPLGRILYLKWKYDRPHTDWVRLIRIHGHFLPNLITGDDP